MFALVYSGEHLYTCLTGISLARKRNKNYEESVARKSTQAFAELVNALLINSKNLLSIKTL